MHLGNLAALIALFTFAAPALADHPEWKHHGSLFLLTTPEGADLPSNASVEGFSVLIRLHRDFFDFRQAMPNGEDLRFSSARGEALPFQIEEWNAAKGIATIWVRVPRIQGNSRQEIKLHWGKAGATTASDGKAVFNESNGYLGVWHMQGSVKDEVGGFDTKDIGTTATEGVVGPARHLAGKQGLFCGDKVTILPTGASSHSSEAWLRAEKPNGKVVAWGNEHAQGKVVMNYSSPPHVKMDCYFSGANVAGGSRIPLGQWSHVVHTYEKGASRVYVNGVLDGASITPSSPMAIKSPARMFIGGWYNNYDFVGDLDEVRISTVARSPEWIRLQYENQKPMQTLVGPVVQPGKSFGVSATKVAVDEGQSVTLTAQATGAQKIYWIVKRAGRENIAAVDRLTFTFDAGRVVGEESTTLQFKAIYADDVKTADIAITTRETIPEPEFTLEAPATWDGRATIEVVPHVTNVATMQAKGAGEWQTSWSIANLATIHESASNKLILKRAQNSGPLTITAAVHNGGKPMIRTATIQVKEPAHDAWVTRTPAKDEQPEDNQFYARDDSNEGTLHYNGALTDAAESVILTLYADGKKVDTTEQKLTAGKAYALSIKLKPGLIKYKVEFGTKSGGRETILRTVDNLVCGDAYLINGQSNAVATDFGKEDPTFRSDWIRTFGSMSGNPKGLALWGNAVHRSHEGGKLQVGYWGMELARRLVEQHQMPICLINGAVGGTRIDQHQRNEADPEDMTTIYGRLLWRTRQAKLTHGIRGVLWHQGENDQGADGPTGGFGWETYRQYFIDLAAAWKQDYPNIRHYYAFQIWPKSCAMGINGSDNRLREVQRNLPTAFSNLSLMSTLGINPPGGCHFPAAGYAEFARLICPLIERDHYGKKPTTSVTPPNLARVDFTESRDEVVMEFDQPVKWDDALVGQFSLDLEKGKVTTGRTEGNRVILKLSGPSNAKSLTYLDSAQWSQEKLLRGVNGLAAFTFCEVPILANKP